MKRIRFFFITTITYLIPFFSLGQSSAIVLQNQRELFIDDYLIAKLEKVETRLATPISGGTALKFDEPWEGRFSGAYVSVVNDGEKFRMYYRGVGEGQGALGQVTCYAESTDGIRWIKPKLKLFKVKGTYDNNVVMLGNVQQSTHNFSVLYDNNPGVPASEKFKAVGGVASSPKRKLRGLYRYVSADGIHWQPYKDSTPLFRDGYGMDSHNVLTWLPSEKCYAIYLRTWTGDKPGDTVLLKGVRTIARSVSKDFIHWSEPQVMKFGEAPMENLYTNATHPYFRASQILIAMPFRFSPQSRVLTDEEMKANDIDSSMWRGVSDAVIMSSRGGTTYERRFLESFVRPGLDSRNWAARSTIPAHGVIPTGSKEMSFFVTRAYGTKDCYLERMRLRLDGFASLHAGYSEGYALTKQVVLRGNRFFVNYSTSSVGYIKVILLDLNGKELPGFGETNAPLIRGDKIDAEVKWESGKTLKDVGKDPVHIKFILKDADVYSFAIF